MSTSIIWIILVATLAPIAIGVLILFLLLNQRNKNKTIESEKKVTIKIETSTSELALLFGGKQNVESINNSSSRVTIVVKDESKLDSKKIEEQFKDVLFTNNKVIFVVGEKAEEFSSQLKNKIFN